MHITCYTQHPLAPHYHRTHSQRQDYPADRIIILARSVDWSPRSWWCRTGGGCRLWCRLVSCGCHGRKHHCSCITITLHTCWRLLILFPLGTGHSRSLSQSHLTVVSLFTVVPLSAGRRSAPSELLSSTDTTSRYRPAWPHPTCHHRDHHSRRQVWFGQYLLRLGVGCGGLQTRDRVLS